MRRSTLVVLAPLALVFVLVLAASAGARPASHSAARSTVPLDPEVVLPSRVLNGISRAQKLLDLAEISIDTKDSAKAIAALNGISAAALRADKAARAQMNGVPADPESPPGPDAVAAVLALDQTLITTMTGLFDGTGGLTVDAATHALFSVMSTRDKLVNAVIALPAEGAGADYAGGMTDAVPGYDDEVSNITEAIANDKLSAGGAKVLHSALTLSTATDTKVNAAFSGA
jgi:hypothetical protein